MSRARAAAEGPLLDLLCPELYAREGGVQAYGRALLAGLLAVLPPSARLRVFVRNDRADQLPKTADPRLEWHPCGGRRPWATALRLATAVPAAGLRRRPRLAIATHPHLAPLLWLHGRLAGCPTAAAAHGIDVWTLQAGPRRWALGRLSRLLPVSRFTAARLRRRLAPGPCPPFTLLPNTVDTGRFRPGPRPPALLARYGLAAQQPLILCLSRLSVGDRAKHIDRLIRAMPALLGRHPGLRLLIGGDGDDRPRLLALVRERKLQESVLLPGRLAEEELADHYRLASVFALPSEKEGFGIVFLEALACGTPVLAGNRDGSADPLADGELGLLVDPTGDLAVPLDQLLRRQGPALWFDPPALAAAAGARFGPEAQRHRLAALLQEMLAR